MEAARDVGGHPAAFASAGGDIGSIGVALRTIRVTTNQVHREAGAPDFILA
jgi:hypothetical protein